LAAQPSPASGDRSRGKLLRVGRGNFVSNFVTPSISALARRPIGVLAPRASLVRSAHRRPERGEACALPQAKKPFLFGLDRRQIEKIHEMLAEVLEEMPRQRNRSETGEGRA
jgi:hypothetical protein